MAISGMHKLAGDDAVRAATGRAFAAWTDILNQAGAADWPHPVIARWLADEQQVEGWWAQNLTVRYEQAIGRRMPGQQSDGTFAASASRRVSASEPGAFDAVVAAASAELGQPPRTRRTDELRPNARWTLPSGETALVAAEPGDGRLRIAVMFEKLPDSEASAAAKERAARILEAALGA